MAERERALCSSSVIIVTMFSPPMHFSTADGMYCLEITVEHLTGKCGLAVLSQYF